MTDGLMDPGTGKPRLLSEQCATCVGRPGNGLELRPGRLKELIRANTGDGKTGLICHETIDYSEGENPEYGGDHALCRWFYDNFGHLANFIRICERLGGFTEVPPPAVQAACQCNTPLYPVNGCCPVCVAKRDSVSAPPESGADPRGGVDSDA